MNAAPLARILIVASAALAGERPDLLRGWLQAKLEAQRFMAVPRNSDEVIRAVARHLPGESERALRLALSGAYPESQGGAAVRRVFPFTFSDTAIAVVREAHRSAQQRGLAPAGELRVESAPRRGIVVVVEAPRAAAASAT